MDSPPASPALVAFGTMALDTIETPHGSAERVVGGSAVYFSAAASLYASVGVIGIVGSDFPLGDLAFLEDRGVDLSAVHQEPGASFHWRARYGRDLLSRETLEDRRGVSSGFRPRVPERFRAPRAVFLGSAHPGVQLAVVEQIRGQSPDSGHSVEEGHAPAPLIACDTMLHWIEDERDAAMQVVRRSQVLFVNEEEARSLGGHGELVGAAETILERGPRWVVIKKGALGAELFGAGHRSPVSGFGATRVVDPTGAGDAFAGGFLGFLATTDRPGPAAVEEEALRHASAVGSFAVESFSVERFRSLTLQDVEERLESGPPPTP